jgi:hypothetical protein
MRTNSLSPRERAGVRAQVMRRSEMQKQTLEEFPIRNRLTVSRLCVGDICWTCECRILEIGGDDGITLAWCDCGFPEDHHEMEIF